MPGTGAEAIAQGLRLPLGGAGFPLLQPLGQQALAQASQQGLPVGRVGAKGQVQLKTGLVRAPGLGAEPELEGGLAQQAKLGRAQTVAFLEGSTDQPTGQQAIDQGGEPSPLQHQQGIRLLAGRGFQLRTRRGQAGRAGPQGAGLTLPEQGLLGASQPQTALLKGQEQGGERAQQFTQGGARPIDRFRGFELVQALALQALGRCEFQA